MGVVRRNPFTAGTYVETDALAFLLPAAARPPYSRMYRSSNVHRPVGPKVADATMGSGYRLCYNGAVTDAQYCGSLNAREIEAHHAARTSIAYCFAPRQPRCPQPIRRLRRADLPLHARRRPSSRDPLRHRAGSAAGQHDRDIDLLLYHGAHPARTGRRMVSRYNALVGSGLAIALGLTGCARSTGPYEVGQREAAERVRPSEGLNRLRPVSWNYLKVEADGDSLVQFFVSVEPGCAQLSAIEQEVTEEEVRVSVIVGDADADAFCGLAGRQVEATFKLAVNRGDREIVDGSKPGGSTKP